MSTLAMIRQQCLLLNGARAVEPGFLDEVQSHLGLELADDFREAAEFFDGSGIYVLPLHAIGWAPAPNVLDETRRLRERAGLARQFLVLAQPPASLIVMDCSGGGGRVIWCDDVDVCRLGSEALLTAPDSWPTYTAFLEYLISEEQQDRVNLPDDKA